MKKQLRKIALAVIFSMVAAVFAPAGQVAYAATKTFTYAEQNSGDKVTTLFMDKGEKVDLKFNGVSNWKTYKYKWQSSNSKVAVVDSAGIITAIGNGIATITLKISGGDGTQYTSAGVVVYVGQKQQVSIGTAATEEIKSYTVEMGKSVVLKANGIKDDVGDRYTFNWSSTDTSVAKVSNNGVITTVKPGLTVIQLSVTKKFSGEVMQATPIAVQVTAGGVTTPTPIPTKAPTVAPTKAPGATATPTPTPTVAPANGKYTVTVLTDKSIGVTFANKVTYTRNDIQLSIDYGNNVFYPVTIEDAKLDATGKVMTITVPYALENQTYNIKVGAADTTGTRFAVSIGAPNRMEVTYSCMGQQGVAYACTNSLGIDVPVNLSYKLYYNNIDVTETYKNMGYAYFELVSPINSSNVVLGGDYLYFYQAGQSAQVSATFIYNTTGEVKELRNAVTITANALGNYTITGVKNWTIIKDDSTTTIDWDNPVKSVVAGQNGYKVVALLADSYGNYYSTDERGVNRDKNIYSVNDQGTLFALKGYSFTFHPDNDTNFYIDPTGSIFTYAAEGNARVSVNLFDPSVTYGMRTIGTWNFTILAAGKLSKATTDEPNVTLLTRANNNETRFCEKDISIRLSDQYGNPWGGAANLTVTSNVATLNSVMSSVANITVGDETGEWILHVDGKSIAQYCTYSVVNFIVKDSTTNVSTSVRVSVLTPPTAVGGSITVSSWGVGVTKSTISFGNGQLNEANAKTEIELYQKSPNGYNVGLLDGTTRDENGNLTRVYLQTSLTSAYPSAQPGDIYVLVTAPDNTVVPQAAPGELGVSVDGGKVVVTVTKRNADGSLSSLPKGTYRVTATKINAVSGSYVARIPMTATFVVEDKTKDVSVIGYNNGKRTTKTLGAYSMEDIVLELFNFALGGTRWTTLTRDMITVDYASAGSSGAYRINSIEFAIPAEGENLYQIKYKKTVPINQIIYTGSMY